MLSQENMMDQKISNDRRLPRKKKASPQIPEEPNLLHAAAAAKLQCMQETIDPQDAGEYQQSSSQTQTFAPLQAAAHHHKNHLSAHKQKGPKKKKGSGAANRGGGGGGDHQRGDGDATADSAISAELASIFAQRGFF